ncbi:beta-microseminoprotein-like [Pecten maximus]|uniref:beta-microseminoprotein-like n=1 Tax=Pecten maximus TaxID=6579 RepID=UPI00145843A6|nr:beta-microseminoprotein-like [Pecten maximus]
MSALWIIALVCAMSMRVESSCMLALPGPDGAGCTYRGHHIAAGDTYRDMDSCMSCSCGTDSSMQCCGFGHAAGVFSLPDGCFMLKDGCDFKIVSSQNHLQPCQFSIVG